MMVLLLKMMATVLMLVLFMVLVLDEAVPGKRVERGGRGAKNVGVVGDLMVLKRGRFVGCWVIMMMKVVVLMVK